MSPPTWSPTAGDGCDADPESEPTSERRVPTEVRARLAWTGIGPVRSERPDVDVRDAVAEGVVQIDALGRTRLGPTEDALLSAFDGMEE